MIYNTNHLTNILSYADGLSCLPLRVCDSLTFSVPSSFNISQIQALPVTSTHIQRATRRDPILTRSYSTLERVGLPLRLMSSILFIVGNMSSLWSKIICCGVCESSFANLSELQSLKSFIRIILALLE